MGKKYTVGAKRRAKKAMPQLAEVPRRGKDKCFVERTRQQPADPNPEQIVLAARARQAGYKGSKDDMRSAAYGEDAGRAIYAFHRGDTAKKLWETYSGCSAAYDRFLRVCLGASIHAKTAKIEMMPERFEVDPNLQHDDRTEDERHRAASNKWRDWKDALNEIDLDHSASIYAAMCGWSTLMEGGAMTGAGRRFVFAIEALAKHVG